jgi:hypothetical protein
MNNRRSNSGRTLNRTQLAKVLIVFFVAMNFCVPVCGQAIGNKQLSSLHLPTALRDRLIERFNLFIECERTQSYDKQFDLLAKTHLAKLLHMNVTKENYVKFKEESEVAVGKLIKLRIKKIKRTSDSLESLSFSVIAKLQKGNSTYLDKPIFVAYLLEGDWYFSLMYIN